MRLPPGRKVRLRPRPMGMGGGNIRPPWLCSTPRRPTTPPATGQQRARLQGRLEQSHCARGGAVVATSAWGVGMPAQMLAAAATTGSRTTASSSRTGWQSRRRRRRDHTIHRSGGATRQSTSAPWWSTSLKTGAPCSSTRTMYPPLREPWARSSAFARVWRVQQPMLLLLTRTPLLLPPLSSTPPPQLCRRLVQRRRWLRRGASHAAGPSRPLL